jgi:hypothetical protein
MTTTHEITVVETPTTWTRVCSCGYESAKLSRKRYPVPQVEACPRDDRWPTR